ncbi:amino acid adenylation domain-containing protein [Streptomyces sp. NPDC093510]|uniref:non-ribosomal peptide synthetase/type I polyketide synthase n=1 Tax=Streptomyces sp. NPDC093510 TaxID=3155199 RepID=UPI0034121A6B
MHDRPYAAASFEQERAYVLDRVGPDDAALHVHRAVMLREGLSAQTARESLRRSLDRHDILRTALIVEGGRLVQVVHEGVEPEVVVADVSADSGQDPEPQVRLLIAEFVRRPFALAAPPLWRLLLVRLSPHRQVAVLSAHAAVADDETLMLLLRELTAQAGPSGTPRQYQEHATRQAELSAEQLARHRSYWRNELGERPEPAGFPVSQEGATPSHGQIDTQRHVLPPSLVEASRLFAERAGCSLSAVLATGLMALLRRYAAGADTVIGCSFSARSRQPSGPQLGPYENTALLRLGIQAPANFLEAVQDTAERLGQAETHRDYPFQKLARELKGADEPGLVPPYRLHFRSELDWAQPNDPLTESRTGTEDYTTAFAAIDGDMGVTIRRLPDGPALDWDYRPEMYDPQLVAQFAAHYEQLLAAALDEPERPVAESPYLSESDLDAVKQRWNTMRTTYRRCSVHELIEEQVARSPDAVAVEHDDQSMSYAELNRSANRLAHHLGALGVAPGDMVGVCLDRSADLVVAVLAVLKAGCAVVPLDAAYPQERLGIMLQEADVRSVVTTGVLLAHTPGLDELFHDLRQVRLDADERAIRCHESGDPEDHPAAEAAAYCIFTSGSTGRPKGVVVEHGALANLVAWHEQAWLTGVGLRTVLYSPISFDVAFHELAAGLCTGATLVQVDEPTRRNPLAMLDFARRRRIEKWYLPFVSLQQVAQAARTGAVPESLRELVIGGEVLRVTDEIRDFARRTGCVIRNHYGSTECLDLATHTLSGDPRLWPAIAPIGRASVHNMNLYILDEQRQLLPVGAVGEIYGEGDCLARGYHGRPQLTQERFTASPFAAQGQRLYRMGDLGRYLPDGTIECLGRADRQMKIRGYRVEPSEVEAALAGHPAVAECVVAARQAKGGRQRLVGYVVPHPGQDDGRLPEQLRSSLAERLPEHMIPGAVVMLEALPLTPSGKVDVRSLPEPHPVARQNARVPTADPTGVIVRIWRDLLDRQDIDTRRTFFDLGGDSLLLVRAHQRIEQELGRELPAVALFQHPTVEALATFLAEQPNEGGQAGDGEGRALRANVTRGESTGGEIAVVGMACRVPGAADTGEFWANLCAGVESVGKLSTSEVFRLERDQTQDAGYVPAAAMIDDIDHFDAEFFGYSPAEAAVIDPQQRLFLECAWQALEDAGAGPERTRIGVYAGASLSTYLINNVLPAKLGSRTYLSHRHFDEATELRIEQGNSRDHLPTRVSYKLGLRGPSVNVQSTCSTSLVAVHLARQALLAGDCEVALAGGVSVITPQNTGYLYRDGMMLAPDGHCRAFDSDAAGTVFGNGLGVVVLKRLSAALADGDQVYAVLKGSAVNNDGAGKQDYSGPSVAAQADVIQQAHRSAGVRSAEISYVEAHGTGTKLGDPIEIAGLTEAFRRGGMTDRAACAIGSVKTNIGHLDEAAGVIGLIKTVLSLHHRQIPATLNFRSPNPLAGLEDSPFFVNTELRAWRSDDGRPRRAGVSSFGMGGTNCHVVLEESPVRRGAPRGPDETAHLLPISARSPEALRTLVQGYAERLAGQDDEGLADICFSAATGRRHFGTRLAIQASGAESARARLASLATEPRFDSLVANANATGARPRICFLFTGFGSQYAEMGRPLYDSHPVFREALAQCDEILRPMTGRSLISTLYDRGNVEALADTALAQPAVFAVSYALSRLWESWGVRPDLVLGHSLGEYAAACTAGVFGIEDALKLVALRAKLMAELPRTGGMMQVNADVDTVRRYLARHGGAVSVAAANAPDMTVISGPHAALKDISAALLAAGVDGVPMRISHAFHSPLMDPILEPYREIAHSVQYRPPQLRIISNLTGEPAAPGELDSPDYWVRHITGTIRFDRAMRTAASEGADVFVELGPKPVLIGLGKSCVTAPEALWLPSLSPKDPDAAITALGRLYEAGADVDWAAFHASPRIRVPLPGYPFQRGRHWIESAAPRPDRQPVEPALPAAKSAGAGAGAAPAAAFETIWESVEAPATQESPMPGRWALVGEPAGLAGRLAGAMRAAGGERVEAVARKRLPEQLKGIDRGTDTMHLVFAPGPQEAHDIPDAAARLLADARDLVAFAAARSGAVRLWFVSSESAHGVPATEGELAQGGLAALARTVAVEHPELRCGALALPVQPRDADIELAARVLGSTVSGGNAQLAVRDGGLHRARLVPLSTPDQLSTPEQVPQLSVRRDGCYLITGGTGGLGLLLAQEIALRQPARLVLLSRHGEPAPEDAAAWEALLATGVRIDVVRADVADEARVAEALADCGPQLRGVFHCAGAVADGILLRQTDERMATVLRPKVTGAWHLHRLTQDHSLDFFVLYSSLAAQLGYGGQGSYAFANAFLDSLARHRWQRGLPALSVGWGSWAGAGMTTRLSTRHQESLKADGEIPLAPQHALASLAALVGRVPHAVVADLNPAVLEAMDTPALSPAPGTVHPATEDAAAVAGPQGPFTRRLRAAGQDEARVLVRDTVAACVRVLLGDEAGQDIDADTGFEDLGIDSLGALDLRGKLEDELGLDLPTTLAFEHSCLNDLVRHLEEQFAVEIEAVLPVQEAAAAPAAELSAAGDVAIIGMSCRFPGAGSPDEFWTLLDEGRDAAQEIPDERWRLADFYDPSVDAPGKMYVRRAALIDDADCFDAAFFGISPREAACMDPRQRLLLELAWSAIESAGIAPGTLRGSDTGVFIGGDEFINDYLRQAAAQLGEEPYLATGTTLSFAAGRISYKLGLHGASMVLSTACSSSLVALHTAVRAIRHGECAMAVVGAGKLLIGPEETVQLCKLRALAPDGRSKVFAAGADGYSRGEGCAAVLLKGLDQAVADGDPVLAVIRGTAVNHDGPSSGLTVPNGGSQVRLINRALADARLAAKDVGYVEAHGTGTRLGDPIELRALGEALGERPEPLLVGSVKANIGHLEEAAGLAGLIKTVLSLRHGRIPRQLHCTELTPEVDWEALRLAVPREGTAWPADAPRIAGVSSFGASGTNAHAVLESYRSAHAPPTARPSRLVFVLTGRDEDELALVVQRFITALGGDEDPAGVAWTLQSGRRHHARRLAVVAQDIAELRTRLESSSLGEDPQVFRGEAGAAEGGGRPTTGPSSESAAADLARRWCAGEVIDWRTQYGEVAPHRVVLPTQPFRRERLWTGAQKGTSFVPSGPSAPPNSAVSTGISAPPASFPSSTEVALPATPNNTHTPPMPNQAAEQAARADVLEALREHLASLLGVVPEDLEPDADFDALGTDSLTFMRVSQFVRDRFKVVLAFQQLFDEARSLDELVTLVYGQLPAQQAGEAAIPATPAPPVTESGVRSEPSALQGGSEQARQPAGQPTAEQLRFLSDLTERFTARTPRSKTAAERERSVMANCRMPPFQPLCKEISYPIVAESSAGARFRDIDGNDYLDISMGYGVHLFGHQPDFIVDALKEQLHQGFHIGPQDQRAGRVAELLCELTGMDRAVFCNSGTEAVMASLRFARAATKRTRFVMFEGSYHGWSDHTLALPAGPRNSIPMARGVSTGAMDEVVVLEYGAAESLATIRELGPELAAVLVEPVQSRRPDLQPKWFLKELRELTRAAGTALIFDEVVTGFRLHPGGAQAWADVDADIAVYGKILGGGMPVGAVAGRAAYLDTVDGGRWAYGDDSAPTVPTTFFGGTFNKNPLTMAAAHAVLTTIKTDGERLQTELADRVSWLADDFNAFCLEEGYPLRIVHFSSVFRFIGEGEYSLQRFPLAIDLFFHLLALKGIYVLETRVCFLSTSHTREDLRLISRTAQECLEELRRAGFFPAPPKTAPTRSVEAVTSAKRPSAARLTEDARVGDAYTVPRVPAAGTDVLLSGATGFLGAYLTRDLLRSTAGRVHCLVRADDAEQARERVLDNLAVQGGLDSLDAEARARLTGVPADLAEPRLGLTEGAWQRLAEQTGSIYHCGAHVNSLLPYGRLSAANVEGTRELLRLATHGGAKAFHHISSDAVFDAYGYLRQSRIYEDEPLAHADTLYGGGYAESKWVADQLVADARAAGLRASVYRPGALTGALTGGCGQLGDFFTRFLKGVIQLGSCPELDATIDFAPVDHVSRAIVELSLRQGAGGTFHLTHPEPVSYEEFMSAVRAAGYNVETVPLYRWLTDLEKLRYEDGNALYPLMPLFTESSAPVFRRARLDVRNTTAKAGPCPPLLELVPRYLDRYSTAGYLPWPDVTATQPGGRGA